MAFRMQTSVPGSARSIATSRSRRWDLYGPDAKEPGTFAYNCLLARRMAERGVRFTQIYHRGWDVHSDVGDAAAQALCHDVDRACYALITDLKQRGLLDDTLVIWGGEFGRTVYSQGGLSKQNYGRDHHPKCLTVWMAGGGMQAGHRLRRRPTTSATTSPQTRCTCATSRDDFALPGHRSREADLQVPGAGSEADRRDPGEGDDAVAGLVESEFVRYASCEVRLPKAQLIGLIVIKYSGTRST